MPPPLSTTLVLMLMLQAVPNLVALPPEPHVRFSSLLHQSAGRLPAPPPSPSMLMLISRLGVVSNLVLVLVPVPVPPSSCYTSSDPDLHP